MLGKTFDVDVLTFVILKRIFADVELVDGRIVAPKREKRIAGSEDGRASPSAVTGGFCSTSAM